VRARGGPLVWLLAAACDPTLATRDKGARLVQALVDALVGDIERLRAAPLPEPK
jgi:creatinine amidohydrolase/Fe(II)-dependent formamide hydrolase-like protein